MKFLKRSLCLLLALVMVLGYIPGAIEAEASQEDGLCATHHAEHSTEICGYIPAEQGTPCTHTELCDDSCKQPVTVCNADHTTCGGCAAAVQGQDCNGTCDYAVNVAAVACDCPENEDGTVTHGTECSYEVRLNEAKSTYFHNEACGYAEFEEAQYCGHECTVDSGCITMQCSHEHNEACGYSEGSEGAACQFAGQECQQCAAEADAECDENCMLEEGHADDCVLYCETEFCAKAQGHEEPCAMFCGCPVTVPEHLETCEQYDTFEQELPMYAWLGDKFLSSLSTTAGVSGPSVIFHAEENTESAYFDNVQSSNENIVKLIPNGGWMGAYILCGVSEGTAKVTAEAGGRTYSLTVTVAEGNLATTPDGSGQRQTELHISEGDDFYSEFYLGSYNSGWSTVGSGTFASSDTNVLTVEQCSNPPFVCRLEAVSEGTAKVIFTTAEGLEFELPVTVTKRMTAVREGSDETLLSQDMTTSDSVKMQFYLSGVEGPLTGLTASSDMIRLEALEGEGNWYQVTAVHQGMADIRYTDAEGKVYTHPVNVINPPQTEGYLYYNGSDNYGNNYPVTCMNLPIGNSFGANFYFGDTKLDGDDVLEGKLTASGPIEIVVDDYNNVMIRAKKENDVFLTGTGYLEYRTTEGEGVDQKIITNCLVVNVIDPNRYRVPTGTQNGSYLHYGDTVIGFGDLAHGLFGDTESMILDHEVTGGFSDVYQDPFRHRALLAAISGNGQPDMDLIGNRIENVKFSVLSCVYNDGAPSSGAGLSLLNEDAVWYDIGGGVGSWMNTYAAGGTTAFHAKVGMQFDLHEEDTIRRISLYTSSHNVFMGNEVRVYADDIQSAKQLNVILSSYESLVNWVKNKPYHEKDTGREYVDTACNIHIVLPARKLTDAVVVSQAIAELPFTERPISTPDFRIYLEGSSGGNNRTVLAGLISKGSVFGVRNISFEANPNVTMTRSDQDGPFTCGIMADPEWDGTVQYDKDTMITTEAGTSVSFYDHYAVDPENRTLASWNNDMANWHSDIISMGGCTFKGFDFGVYSTPNGYVGGGADITITDCYYGLYIDCADKPYWNMLESYADYNGYNFKKNVVAVRIKGLQGNMSPYEFRIHDSDFINNYLEFWIDDYTEDYLPNYYFYRNHYRGGWKLNNGNGNGNSGGESSGYGWVKNWKVPDGESLPDVHRAPRYSDTLLNTTGNGVQVVISGTPGKATPNLATNALSRSASAEGYWIYDGTDQVTRIELNGDSLPLAQEALEALENDADVSVVTNQGRDTVAIWTFEGGE